MSKSFILVIFTVVSMLHKLLIIKVGNLGLLFFLLFFIFAALGVELFGRLGEYVGLRGCS